MLEPARSSIAGKVLLVTGGTGSFGQKFTELALKHDPKAIRIFSRGELLQVQMEQHFRSNKLRFFIGDVRDRDRLRRAMVGAGIVVHAAALKHVPVCEYNPMEAVRTNILGAVNLIEAALDLKPEKVIAISTDKAVHPVNLYGATKLVSEKLFAQANTYSAGGNPRFSVVRYGNVVGSRGSVIPVFLEHKKYGELQITDKRMTRFWITLEQGVNFVLSCLDQMVGGEVFIPKLPAMKVTDLAKAIAPEAKYKFVGIRPGEKLHEVLLSEDEARHSKELPDRFVIEPEFLFWRKETLVVGESLPDGFSYRSNKVPALGDKEIGQMVARWLESRR